MHGVLFEGNPIKDAIGSLMNRDLRSEQLR